jgi:hypothetical protein
MINYPVFIFGAGATAECGGPLTSELLPAVIELLAANVGGMADYAVGEQLSELGRFLRECFHLDVDEHWRIADSAVFPSVPLLLSLINLAVDRGQPIGSWSPEQLASLRIAVQTALLGAIEVRLTDKEHTTNPYERLFEPLYRADSAVMPAAITLNYDTILDKVMVKLGSASQRRVPDYGCDIFVGNPQPTRFGRLLKLHGSLNWLYCRRCSRLSLHMSGLVETKGFWDALGDSFADLAVLLALDRPDEAACPRCRGQIGPLMITPSHLKDYRNPHISRIWYEAEQSLRNADRAIFVGYSLPWDDVEVIYLLKQSLEHLPPERITVVEFSKTAVPIEQHEAGRRYLSLFSRRIHWCPLGFQGWLDDCQRRGISPLDPA